MNGNDIPTENNSITELQSQEGERRIPRLEWDFHLSTVISSTQDSPDALSAIEIDPSDHLLATGGLARKIRIYPLAPLLAADSLTPSISDHSDACDFFICAPAKLSSLRFRPDSSGQFLAAGDYDGVVTEYDLIRRLPVFERDEHAGRRVWSVDYARWAPHLGASGSDDATLHLWDTRSNSLSGSGSASVGSAVCSVEFDPGGGPGIGVGCANRRAYLYDVRAMSAGPVVTFFGHGRTVTYFRSAGGGRVVTSATDGTHRMWEMSKGVEVRVYRGHRNSKNFVGMSVLREGGLIACGSESNEMFIYDLRWTEPVWIRRFGDGDGFVSAVCWRERPGGDQCTLVGGGSNGALQVFAGKRKQLIL